MRVALVHNEPLPSRYHGLGEELAVSSIMDSVKATQESLTASGHAVSLLGLRPPLTDAGAGLAQLNVDLVFNLFEGFDGRPETEWQLAQILESLGRPFTGASSATLALCLHKARAKRRLEDCRLPTPPYQLLHSGNAGQFSLQFPVIVKPLQEDASHGLSSRSVVQDAEALMAQLLWVEGNYSNPVLVESFLPGREFSASILGRRQPRVFPLSEMVYSNDMPGPRILTFAAKWMPQHPEYQATTLVCPAPVSETLAREISELALAAHKAVGSPPYARVDLRSDAQGRLYVLEINPNPDLWPDAGLAYQGSVAGLSYGRLIEAIVEMALEETRTGGCYAAYYAA